MDNIFEMVLDDCVVEAFVSRLIIILQPSFEQMFMKLTETFKSTLNKVIEKTVAGMVKAHLKQLNDKDEVLTALRCVWTVWKTRIVWIAY